MSPRCNCRTRLSRSANPVAICHLGRDDLYIAPFDGKGGLGRMYKLFGDQMDNVIDELNGALAA